VLGPQRRENVLFRCDRKVVEVALDGEEVGPETIAKGQRAEVDYVVAEGEKIARSVRLESTGGG
jgi:hypothetical protein